MVKASWTNGIEKFLMRLPIHIGSSLIRKTKPWAKKLPFGVFFIHMIVRYGAGCIKSGVYGFPNILVKQLEPEIKERKKTRLRLRYTVPYHPRAADSGDEGRAIVKWTW